MDLGDTDDDINGQSSYDYLGSSLAFADIDGDGYMDIITGAPGDDGKLDLMIPAEDQGTAWLFLDADSLSADTSVSSADHTFSGAGGDYASSAVSDSDLDGDGGFQTLRFQE